MNKLLTVFFIFSVLLGNTQSSDTVSCVSGPNVLEYVVHYNHQSCFDSCNANAYIQVLQGSGNYTYSWLNGSGYSASHPDPDSLCPEDYTVIVTDITTGIACTQIFTIDSLQPFTHSISTTNVTATGACDGTAELNLSGGVQPYIISWYDANQNLILNEDSTFIDSLCAGNYFYQVGWNSNCGPADTIGGVGNGTGGLIPFSISEPITVVLDWSMNETCFSFCDGGAQFSALGGDGNYTFDIGFGPQSNGIFMGLCGPNLYTVTVTDGLGGIGTADVFIMEGQMVSGTYISTDVSCFGTCDGTINVNDNSWDMNLIQIDIYDGSNLAGTATVSGGSGFVGNLCAGVYQIYGTSNMGCMDLIGTVTINEPSPLSLSPSVTNESFPNACDGTIDPTNTTGGTPGYTWELYDCSNNFISSGTGIFTGLCAGCYTICTIDANGCQSCTQVSVGGGCNMTATYTATNVSCNGACDGSASFNITNGTPPFTYTWCDGTTGPINQNLCAGICQVTIADASGCIVNLTIQITQPPLLNLSASHQDESAFGACDGTITPLASGGVAPYMYQVFDCSGTLMSFPTSGASFVNVCGGCYNVCVTDANGCQTCSQLTIATGCNLQATSSQTDVTCNSFCDGTATVFPSGGNGVYSYQWDDPQNQTTPTATGLCAGIYICHISDSSGCSYSHTVLITEPSPLQISTVVSNDSSTQSNCIGSIGSNITGGTAGYTYNWIDCATQNTVSTSDSATQLCPGTYMLIVTDMNGCTISSSCDTIFDNTPNGLIEGDMDLIFIYPNPARNNLTIESEWDSFEVSIYNLNGKLITEQQVYSKSIQLNLEPYNLTRGVYQIQLKHHAVTIHKKLIIE